MHRPLHSGVILSGLEPGGCTIGSDRLYGYFRGLQELWLPSQSFYSSCTLKNNPSRFHVKLWKPYWPGCICEILIMDAKIRILCELLIIIITGILQMQKSCADFGVLTCWHAKSRNLEKWNLFTLLLVYFSELSLHLFKMLSYVEFEN